MGVKGLEQAVKNLNSINSRMVPQACVWAVNKVAQKAITQAVRKTARTTVAGDNRRQGIPVRLVRQRVKLWKASATFSVDKQRARIRINRGNLPAIKLGTAQVRLTRKRGKLLRGGSVLKIGPYLFRDAFIQQLANGRWHVLRRTEGKKRYPIDVVKIPLTAQLTQAFEEEKTRILTEEMPKELAAALKQQFRLYLTRF